MSLSTMLSYEGGRKDSRLKFPTEKMTYASENMPSPGTRKLNRNWKKLRTTTTSELCLKDNSETSAAKLSLIVPTSHLMIGLRLRKSSTS